MLVLRRVLRAIGSTGTTSAVGPSSGEEMMASSLLLSEKEMVARRGLGAVGYESEVTGARTKKLDGRRCLMICGAAVGSSVRARKVDSRRTMVAWWERAE